MCKGGINFADDEFIEHKMLEKEKKINTKNDDINNEKKNKKNNASSLKINNRKNNRTIYLSFHNFEYNNENSYKDMNSNNNKNNNMNINKNINDNNNNNNNKWLSLEEKEKNTVEEVIIKIMKNNGIFVMIFFLVLGVSFGLLAGSIFLLAVYLIKNINNNINNDDDEDEDGGDDND